MPGAGRALLAHSGGPTAVINASLLGVVEEARQQPDFRAVYGARFGIDGILNGDFVDLLAQSEATLLGVANSPSSALGSSRREVTEADLARVLEVLRAHDVRYFFYNGGNGSMGTALHIAEMARHSGYELHVVGIPKTIDNDVMETDHTPGYASTARFFASAVREIGADNRSLPGQVEIVEVLGRNAGWIVAATMLARAEPDDAPHLIYLPEQPLPLARLLADVERVFRRLSRCVVVVCEGQLDERGEPFGADVRAGSRGTLAMNLGHRLALLVTQHLGTKARSEKPGLLGRASQAMRSQVDWDEARLCGQAAVRAAARGLSGTMVTLVRQPGPAYSAGTDLCPLERVAFIERLFPAEWRTAEGNDVSPAFREYIMPLVIPLAAHRSLDPAIP